MDISRDSGVPTGRIYDVLRNLAYKGLVTREGNYYRVLPPKQAYAEMAYRELMRAKKKASTIMSLAELIEDLAPRTSDEWLRYIFGVEESLAAAMQVLSNCKEGPVYFTVYAAARKLPEMWPLLEDLTHMLPPSTRILVSPGLKPTEEQINALRNAGVEVREHECVIFDSMAACDTVLLGLPSKAFTVVTAYIKQRDFASAVIERLNDQWERARIPSWYV